MDTEEITNLIMSIVPSVTAIITAVSAIVVCMINIKRLMNNHISDATKENAALRNDMHNMMNENAELKKELKKTVNRLNHVVEVGQENDNDK